MPNILVVDDDALIRDMLVDYFEAQGHHVIAAPNGVSGLRMAQAVHPDLIILDVDMPQMTGLEVCKRLRESPETSKLRILMLTARKTEKDVTKALDLGADAYMPKPFSLAEMGLRSKMLLGLER
ncbi:MAG: response regulator [Elusimicrobia bacterium]|nr:response regulator [Elusimicrobiota bacterium]